MQPSGGWGDWGDGGREMEHCRLRAERMGKPSTDEKHILESEQWDKGIAGLARSRRLPVSR